MAGNVLPESITGVNKKIEILIDGSWVKIPGTADYGASGGEAPETDIVTSEGVSKISGHARVPSVSISVPLYNPLLLPFRHMRANKGSRFTFRLVTEESELQDFGATTLAIAVTGIATLVVGTNDDDFKGFVDDDRVRIGQVIKPDTGSTRYTIDEITSNTGAKLDPKPTSAVAAASTFKLVSPSLIDRFVATVRSGTGYDLPAESGLNKTIALTPTGDLENWEIA